MADKVLLLRSSCSPSAYSFNFSEDKSKSSVDFLSSNFFRNSICTLNSRYSPKVVPASTCADNRYFSPLCRLGRCSERRNASEKSDQLSIIPSPGMKTSQLFHSLDTWSQKETERYNFCLEGTKGGGRTTVTTPPSSTQITLSAAKASQTKGEVLISGSGLAKTYDGLQFLFKDLDITVSRGQKIGLLGANGSGKSTLLKVLAGFEIPDKGTVQQKKAVRLAYLAQDPVLDGELTILDAVLAADTPVMAAVREYEKALAKQAVMGASEDKEIQDMVQNAMEKVEALGAWAVAAEAEKLLEILGVGFLDRQVKDLSGGQRKRVALAATLLAKPELVIMDEPTNHMDVKVIQWMERMLSDSALTVVLVTHDRYFLDSVCNEMVELDNGKGYSHSGNYSSFLANKAQRLVETEAAIARAENTLRKEAEWMRRQPKARSTKSRSRIDRFYALTKKAERGPAVSGLELELGESRLGSKVLALRDATAVRGERVIIDGFTYEFVKGEQMGVVGRNGVGKSTFLDALAGVLPLQSGEREVGETLVLGYYGQQSPPIPDGIRVLDFVLQFGGSVQIGNDQSGGFQGASAGNPPEQITSSAMLERFGFSKQKQYNWASKLSGGEKRRLYLATILMQRPNFLLLDEPTNDLDLPTIEVLENFLLSYEGCLLVASHDRAFMDNVTSRLFLLEGDGEVQLFDGTYSEYMEETKIREKELSGNTRGETAVSNESNGGTKGEAIKAPTNGNAGNTNNAVKKKNSRKLSYMERKEYDGLEKEIEKLSGKKDQLETQLQKENKKGNYGKLETLAGQLATVTASIDAKTERWLELAELSGE